MSAQPRRAGPTPPGEPAPAPTPGWCAREVEQELPGLRLLSAEVEVARKGSLTGGSPADIQGRLRELSNRFRGAAAVAVRREPVPSAYRIFFRHIGLDPEVVRTPIEAAVLERMMKGGFLTGGLLEDVLLIALIDTGVPVWALDAERVDGPAGHPLERRRRAPGPLARRPGAAGRPAGDRRRLGRRWRSCSASSPRGTSRRRARRRLALFAVQVAGVPELYAEEALWICGSSLQSS